jgi:WD40 repeat protein
MNKVLLAAGFYFDALETSPKFETIDILDKINDEQNDDCPVEIQDLLLKARNYFGEETRIKYEEQILPCLDYVRLVLRKRYGEPVERLAIQAHLLTADVVEENLKSPTEKLKEELEQLPKQLREILQNKEIDEKSGPPNIRKISDHLIDNIIKQIRLVKDFCRLEDDAQNYIKTVVENLKLNRNDEFNKNPVLIQTQILLRFLNTEEPKILKEAESRCLIEATDEGIVTSVYELMIKYWLPSLFENQTYYKPVDLTPFARNQILDFVSKLGNEKFQKAASLAATLNEIGQKRRCVLSFISEGKQILERQKNIDGILKSLNTNQYIFDHKKMIDDLNIQHQFLFPKKVSLHEQERKIQDYYDNCVQKISWDFLQKIKSDCSNKFLYLINIDPASALADLLSELGKLKSYIAENLDRKKRCLSENENLSYLRQKNRTQIEKIEIQRKHLPDSNIEGFSVPNLSELKNKDLNQIRVNNLCSLDQIQKVLLKIAEFKNERFIGGFVGSLSGKNKEVRFFKESSLDVINAIWFPAFFVLEKKCADLSEKATLLAIEETVNQLKKPLERELDIAEKIMHERELVDGFILSIAPQEYSEITRLDLNQIQWTQTVSQIFVRLMKKFKSEIDLCDQIETLGRHATIISQLIVEGESLAKINKEKAIEQVVSQSEICTIAFCKSATDFVSGEIDGYLLHWRLKQSSGKTAVIPFTQNKGAITNLLVTSDNKHTVISGLNGVVAIFNLETGDFVNSIQASQKAVLSLSITPDNHLLITGAEDGSINLWRFPSLEHKGTLVGHEGEVTCLSTFAKGEMLASGEANNDPSLSTVMLWSLKDKALVKKLKGHSGKIVNLAVSGDDKILASGEVFQDSEKRIFSKILLWDLEAYRMKDVLELDQVRISSLIFSKRTYNLLSATNSSQYTSEIIIWDAARGVPKIKLEGQISNIRAIAMDADEKVLAFTTSNIVYCYHGLANLLIDEPKAKVKVEDYLNAKRKLEQLTQTNQLKTSDSKINVYNTGQVFKATTIQELEREIESMSIQSLEFNVHEGNLAWHVRTILNKPRLATILVNLGLNVLIGETLRKMLLIELHNWRNNA